MTAPGPDPPRVNPYVGLPAFGEADEPWFFGRDRERRIIGANLRSARLTLVYGASGVGKTSLLQAAVVPDLRAVVARDRALREREDPAMRSPVRFAVSTFASWRDAPLEGLMTAVAASVEEATGEPVAPPEPGTSLRDAFAAWLGPVTTLLVVLDQFEEHFLYHPRDDGPGTFAGEFADVVDDPALHVHFLLSLREDELAKLDRFQGRIRGLFDNFLRVDHLDLVAARRAIEGPCEEYNARLPAGSAPAEIDGDVVDAVLAEVRTRAGVTERPPDLEDPRASARSDRVETPLLQLVMQRLWDAAALESTPPHLRLETLTERLGGTERIVYRHLEAALGALTGEQRELAVDVLRPLVSPAHTKIAWRAEDLAFWAKRPADDIAPILVELSRGERRILRAVAPPPTRPDASPLYEIFHDILAEPVLEWCAARETERERARLAAELEARELERREAEDRRRRERRNRAVRAVAIALAALAIGLIVAILAALDRNEVAQSRALAASATAQLPIDPELGLLLALEAARKRKTDEAEQALRRAVVASRVRAALRSGRARPCRACAGLAATPLVRRPVVAEPLAIAPDGGAVAAVVGERLRLWRPAAGAASAPRVDLGAIEGVAFTPDSKRLVVVGETSTALVVLATMRAIVLRDAGRTGDGAAISRRGLVVTVGGRGAAVWDGATGARRARLTDSGYAGAGFDSEDRVVLQDIDGLPVAWSWRTRRSVDFLASAPAGQAVFAAAPGLVADISAAGRARVVDLYGASLPLPAGVAGKPVTGVALSPGGTRAATVQESVVTLWALPLPLGRDSRATRVGALVHTDGVNAVTFSDDGELVATASTDGTARVWESATGELVADLRGHAAGVQAVAFSSRGRYVATLGEDLTVRLWDLGRERTERQDRSVAAVAVSPSGSRIAIATDEGDLAIVDGASFGSQAPSELRPGNVRRRTIAPPRAFLSSRRLRTRLRSLAAQALHPTSVAFAARAPRLVAGYASASRMTGGLRLMDLDGLPRVDAAVDGAVSNVALDARARVAAVVRDFEPRDPAQQEGTRVELWSLATERPTEPLWVVPLPFDERATDVALSPDGRRLLVTSVYGLARVYDVATRRPLLTLAGGTKAKPGPEAFYRATFNPRGDTVAVAGSRDVRLWDAASGTPRGVRLSGHTSVLRSVAFNAAGDRIVTASADGTVRVWDAATGAELARMSRHAGRVNGAAFLPSGWIVSAGEDRTVRMYPCESCAPAAQLRDVAARHVTRDLTPAERARYRG